MSTTSETTNWPELAIGLYDKLTGRNAEITYEFDNMEVGVPSGVGEQPNWPAWIPFLSSSRMYRTRPLLQWR